MEPIARVLEKINPDSVALPEAVNHEGASIEVQQANFLAERLGHSFAIGRTRRTPRRRVRKVTLNR